LLAYGKVDIGYAAELHDIRIGGVDALVLFRKSCRLRHCLWRNLHSLHLVARNFNVPDR
jgi:hypothetical protein